MRPICQRTQKMTDVSVRLVQATLLEFFHYYSTLYFQTPFTEIKAQHTVGFQPKAGLYILPGCCKKYLERNRGGFTDHADTALGSGTVAARKINHRRADGMLVDRHAVRSDLSVKHMAAGSISDPNKSYHFEIVCYTLEQAQQLKELMEFFETEPKIVERKERMVVYLKEGSQIVDLLNVMEAYVSLMNLENVRILKEMRNSVNRKVNCETANINKTVNAAVTLIFFLQDIIPSVYFPNLFHYIIHVINAVFCILSILRNKTFFTEICPELICKDDIFFFISIKIGIKFGLYLFATLTNIIDNNSQFLRHSLFELKFQF